MGAVRSSIRPGGLAAWEVATSFDSVAGISTYVSGIGGSPPNSKPVPLRAVSGLRGTLDGVRPCSLVEKARPVNELVPVLPGAWHHRVRSCRDCFQPNPLPVKVAGTRLLPTGNSHSCELELRSPPWRVVITLASNHFLPGSRGLPMLTHRRASLARDACASGRPPRTFRSASGSLATPCDVSLQTTLYC